MAVAAPTGYGSNIRQSLVSKGVNNSDIGYNNQTGYITVKGQDFLKPSKVLGGVSYDTMNNFNNAWNKYQNSQAQPAQTTVTSPTNQNSSYVPSGMVSTRDGLKNFGINPSSVGYQNGNTTVNGQYFGTPALNLGGTTYYTPQGMNQAMSNYRINDIQNQVMQGIKPQENPYTQQINDQIKALMQMAQNQQPVDPYSTAQYTAFKAQADRNAQQGIRAAQEALGSSGFGRSTMLGERAQGIQNDANEYLETQVIPQIIANEQARKQQEFSNVMSLLEPLMSQQGYADNRQQQELQNLYNAYGLISGEQQRGLENARADAALTGTYLTPEQQSAISTLLGLKKQAEQQGITKEQRAELNAQANLVRDRMRVLGLDPTQYGANVSYNAASQYTPGRTLQGQQLDMQRQQQEFNQGQQQWENNFTLEQFAYQKARDAIADQQWRAKFDEDVRQFGLNYGLQQLREQNDLAYRQATLALSQDDNDRAWAQLDYQMSQPTSAKESGLSPNQFLDSIKAQYTEPVYQTGAGGIQTKIGTQITKDPGKRGDMFLNVVDAGYSDAQTKQILSALGFSKDEIEKYKKQYSGN